MVMLALFVEMWRHMAARRKAYGVIVFGWLSAPAPTCRGKFERVLGRGVPWKPAGALRNKEYGHLPSAALTDIT